MSRGSVARLDKDGASLFDRIGAFLRAQSLSPDPAHYAFAHAALSDRNSELARAVERLTDGGVRLSRHDIEALGGQVAPGSSVVTGLEEEPSSLERLAEQTSAQVDGFADMVRTIRAETRDFGHDIARSAQAITSAPIAGIDEIARITGTMLGRIRDAEARLARATEEAQALREKLAEARDTARRDALTGLPNRRAFNEAFTGRDPDTRHCLAIIDIDRFKRINDEHGHPIGDRVLSAIARLLEERCAGNPVFRHGGEEFSVLIRGANLATAADMLDAVRAMVAAKRFRDRDSDAPLGRITLSAGITAILPEEAADSAVERADRLLYIAKANGRNQLCSA